MKLYKIYKNTIKNNTIITIYAGNQKEIPANHAPVYSR